MTKHVLLILAGLLAGGLLLSGCQSATEPVEDELAVLRDMIESDPLFTSDALLLDDPNVPSTPKTAASILPVAWGRRVTSATRTVTFDRQGDSVIVATITHSFTGEIKIAAKDSVGDTTIAIVTKPFTESTTRKVRFIRIARTTRPRDNWRMREVSAVVGGTGDSVLTVNRLTVIVGTDSLTITNPLDYYLRMPPAFTGRRMPTVGQNGTITVRFTVTSTQSDTDLVFLHRPFQWLNSSVFRPARVRLTLVSETGSGPYVRTYEHSWNSHLMGRHHFFISAITRNSLFDDTAPWATKMWGIPYMVQ